MKSVLLTPIVAAALFLGTGGLPAPARGETPPVMDFSHAEFRAPALTGSVCDGFPPNWPHPAIPLTHAHFLYAGYDGSAPPGGDLWYCYGLTGPDFLVIPEAPSGKVLLPGILTLLDGTAWRRKAAR